MTIFLRFAAIIALALAAAAAAPAGTEAAAAKQSAADAAASAEFGSFIDGFFAGVRREWNVPGSVFIAVRDGRVLYKRGYGHTGPDGAEPVSPDRTMFRVGEISTLFTAAAVMQLAEKDRLGLDDDVNIYLRRNKLPDRFGKPVTVRQLLTHTAGFDGKTLELGADDEAAERAFANTLSRKMPGRCVEPGASYGWSGMGYALLGSIVERYSRQSFQSALKRHIFTPLDMTSSTFCPTEDEMKFIAQGTLPDGSVAEYARRADLAAMSMSTTARDMGQFMLAALGGGRLGRGKILSELYAGSMLRTHFTPHPKIDGTGIGWRERRAGGVRTLQMSGGLPGYSCFVMLIPEANFGLFYAANVSGPDFSGDLASAVVSRFFGGGAPAARSPDAVPSRARPGLSGSYRHNGASRLTAEKFLSFRGEQIKVTASPDGSSLTLARTGGGGASSPETWLPASDGGAEETDLFRRADEYGALTDEYLFFRRDEAGEVITMTIGDVSRTYYRLESWESSEAQDAASAMSLLVLAASVIGVISGVRFNKTKMPWELEKGVHSAVELWTIEVIFCAVEAVFLLLLLWQYSAHKAEFMVFVPYQVKALFVIPLGCVILCAWYWLRLAVCSFSPEHHWAEKVILFTLGCCDVLYILNMANWRLLGFMF